jgi:hypothetical protein
MWISMQAFGEKTFTMPLCPPQIPHGLAWDWVRASAVKGRRLTVWTMAWPWFCFTCVNWSRFLTQILNRILPILFNVAQRTKVCTSKHISACRSETFHFKRYRKEWLWRGCTCNKIRFAATLAYLILNNLFKGAVFIHIFKRFLRGIHTISPIVLFSRTFMYCIYHRTSQLYRYLMK